MSPLGASAAPTGAPAAPRSRWGRRLERALKRRLIRLALRLFPAKSVAPPALTGMAVRHLLLIRQHNQMGDMVLALPALASLRRAFPQARIVVVTSPLCEELLGAHPDIDRLVVFRKKEVWRPWKVLGLLHSLRRPRPDLALILGTVSFSATSALLAWASGARLRAGVGSRHFGNDLSRLLLNLELPMGPPGAHEVEHNLAPLRGLGLEPQAELPHLPVRPEALHAADAFLQRTFPGGSGPLVVLHPGAGKRENIWPVPRFAEVAASLAREYGARLVVSEGPRDAALVASLLQLVPSAARWRAPLGTTLGILARAALFIGNDTGMAHVAAAVGAPTVAVFGPTEPERWAPAGTWVRCVRSSTGRVEDTAMAEVLQAAQAALSTAPVLP